MRVAEVSWTRDEKTCAAAFRDEWTPQRDHVATVSMRKRMLTSIFVTMMQLSCCRWHGAFNQTQKNGNDGSAVSHPWQWQRVCAVRPRTPAARGRTPTCKYAKRVNAAAAAVRRSNRPYGVAEARAVCGAGRTAGAGGGGGVGSSTGVEGARTACVNAHAVCAVVQVTRVGTKRNKAPREKKIFCLKRKAVWEG